MADKGLVRLSNSCMARLRPLLSACSLQNRATELIVRKCGNTGGSVEELADIRSPTVAYCWHRCSHFNVFSRAWAFHGNAPLLCTRILTTPDSTVQETHTRRVQEQVEPESEPAQRYERGQLGQVTVSPETDETLEAALLVGHVLSKRDATDWQSLSWLRMAVALWRSTASTAHIGMKDEVRVEVGRTMMARRPCIWAMVVVGDWMNG